MTKKNRNNITLLEYKEKHIIIMCNIFNNIALRQFTCENRNRNFCINLAWKQLY